MRGLPITSPMLKSFFYQLQYNVICQTGLEITLPLYLLHNFLHNRIPCMDNAWAADNLTLLDMPLSIIARYNSLKIPKIILALYLLFVKMNLHFNPEIKLVRPKPEQPDRFC